MVTSFYSLRIEKDWGSRFFQNGGTPFTEPHSITSQETVILIKCHENPLTHMKYRYTDIVSCVYVDMP